MKPPPSIGLGSNNSCIHFYIANRPPIDDYAEQQILRGMSAGEIAHIVQNTSNHWRKVFNVYAKLLFDWYQETGKSLRVASWQAYRDQHLLQSHCSEALYFSPPALREEDTGIHIIAGKTYAARLPLPPLTWLDAHFAINAEHRLIVAPYPDYRQLSNERIARLIKLMHSLRDQ